MSQHLVLGGLLWRRLKSYWAPSFKGSAQVISLFRLAVAMASRGGHKPQTEARTEPGALARGRARLRRIAELAVTGNKPGSSSPLFELLGEWRNTTRLLSAERSSCLRTRL